MSQRPRNVCAQTAFLLLLSLCIGLAGCTNQMEPAKKAMRRHSSRIAAVGTRRRSLTGGRWGTTSKP